MILVAGGSMWSGITSSSYLHQIVESRLDVSIAIGLTWHPSGFAISSILVSKDIDIKHTRKLDHPVIDQAYKPVSTTRK